MIKNILEPLVVHYIFPQLCLTAEDAEEWENDPVEYIQRKMDPSESFRSSSSAAENLLSTLVKVRFKSTFVPIMNFVNGILEEYNNADVAKRDCIKKDGAINLIACLAREILAEVLITRKKIYFFSSRNHQ